MDFSFSEEQQAVSDLAKRILEGKVTEDLLRSIGPSLPAAASSARRRSCVARSPKICPASWRTASCSSL